MTTEEAIKRLRRQMEINRYTVGVIKDLSPAPESCSSGGSEAFEMAIAALRAQQGKLDGNPTNAPLTIEELWGMDGEPVWCQSEYRPDGAGWFIVYASAQKPHEFIAVGKERGIPCAGITSGYWEAYRRRPEEGTA